MSLLDDLRSAPPRRQLAIAVATVVALCLLLGAVYFFFLRRPYVELYTGLRPADAAAVVAELDKKKAPYRLADGGSTILVPKDQVEAMRLATVSQDLPLKGMVGFELFNKSDMGLTEFAQKINYQRALQGELARTIMAMDGVDTARVHLSLSEASIFRDDRRPPKASVTVLMRPGRTLPQAMVSGVQRLVAASVPDLDPSAVVVLDDHGRVLSVDAQPATGGPRSQQRVVEDYYAGKVRQALEKAYPGAGYDVTVSAITDADPATPSAAITPAAAPTGEDGASSTQATTTPGGDPLDAWTPGSRKFRLKVDIALSAPLSARVREEMRAAANEAIGYDPALGDIVSVAQAAPPALTSGAADAVHPNPVTGASSGAWLAPATFWQFLLGAALLGLLVAAFVLHRRGAGPRRLSEKQRLAYAERLRRLLDDGEANAAPPI